MLHSPLFVNMTRWGAMYGGPGGNWGNPRLDQAVDQVEARLGLGAGVLPRLLPASDNSADLDYIAPHVRANLGLPNPLFNRAVGSQGGVAGNNGQVDLTHLRGAMNSVWPALPHECFAIIDSDAAHHVSLLLAEAAFANVAAGRAKIVINFDAHTDYSPAALNGASLRCDNWGSFAIRPLAAGVWQPIADVYVMVGTKSNQGQAPATAFGNTTCRFRGGNNASQAVAGAGIRAQMQSLINMVNANAIALNGGAWNGYDVYLTVDRDVEASSFTDYGDGAYPRNVVWQAVHDCLDELDQVPNMAFAGFDLCGLPTWNGGSVATGAVPVQQRFNLALQDVHDFQNEIAAL